MSTSTTRVALLPEFVVNALATIAKKLGFFPDAIAYARAFALGLDSPGFSQATMDECHQALVLFIFLRMSLIKYSTMTPNCNKGNWYNSAAGVVGKYTVETVRFTEEGIHVSCKDTWDFNEVGTSMMIPLGGFTKWVVLVLNYLLKKEIFSVVDKRYMKVAEKDLVVFNHNSFETVWEDFVSWEEVQSSPNEWATNGFTMWERTRK